MQMSVAGSNFSNLIVIPANVQRLDMFKNLYTTLQAGGFERLQITRISNLPKVRQVDRRLETVIEIRNIALHFGCRKAFDANAFGEPL